MLNAYGALLEKELLMTIPAIIQNYIDAYNRKDVTALVECVTDNVMFENISNAGQSLKIEGREAFADLAQQGASMFTTRHQTVRTAVVEGNLVALEVDWTGFPAVDLGPIKAGEEIALRGASFLTIEDGKLCRIVDLS